MERELSHSLRMLCGYRKFYKAVRHNFGGQILAQGKNFYAPLWLLTPTRSTWEEELEDDDTHDQ